MPIDFDAWLQAQGNSRCVLIELDHNDAGVIKTAYFASAAYVSAPDDVPANTAYDPFIVGTGSFERSLNEVFTGRSVFKSSDIELVYQHSTQQLLTKAVYGQAVRIYLGDKTWPKSAFRQIIAGICDGVVPESSTLKIKFRDAADTLKQPLLTSRYSAGTAAGQLQPLALGRCYNIKPVLIDELTHTYQFNSGRSAAVTSVRFNGAEVSPVNYTVDLINSTLTLLIFPQGDVTIDVDGVAPGGAWLQTAAQFIQYIANTRDLSADVVGLPGYLLGLYVVDDVQIADLLDEICASVGGYWFYSRLGQLNVRAFNGITAATVEISRDQTVANSRRIRRVIHPLYAITLQYKRNWTPISNIAASIHESAPALAAELAADGKTYTGTQAILADYPQAGSINVQSLLVGEMDAVTEINRRLSLSAMPRFVYELQVLATPFAWQIGGTAVMEQLGINGPYGVITKLIEQPITGRCSLEVWQ